MTPSTKLFFTSGTVCFRDKDQSAVLCISGDLIWVPKKIMTLVEGEVIWILYHKEGQVRVPESTIPHSQATKEDLLKDFDEETIQKPRENSPRSGEGLHRDRPAAEQGSGKPDEDLSGV